jgi:hypothetical protein
LGFKKMPFQDPKNSFFHVVFFRNIQYLARSDPDTGNVLRKRKVIFMTVPLSSLARVVFSKFPAFP